MKQAIKWSLIGWLLLLAVAGYGQRTKESLQREINALQQEIANANRLLQETSRNRQVTLSQVELMNRRINDRQQLINACNEQIQVLDGLINQGERNINRMNGELQTLRSEYAKMVQFAYRNRSHYDLLEFVFASDDFNQALRRIRYIRQFADARKNKIDQIAATQTRVAGEVEANRAAREEQAALLAEQRTQQEALQRERTELNAQVAQLRSREGSIQQSIQQKQAQAQQFQRQIDAIIAEEIRLANERAAAEARNRAASSGGMALTPTEQALSSNFSANRGRLPWPVERGVISSSFGRHASAISDRVVVTNHGIDIQTVENAKARSVFEGSVVAVVRPSASNIGVIIRHGEYFTVYSQMDEVYVNRGDHVATRQDIGRVHTDRAEGKTELHFELRQGTNCLDPATWLAR